MVPGSTPPQRPPERQQQRHRSVNSSVVLTEEGENALGQGRVSQPLGRLG
jgi:hypothetical protein